MAKVFYYNIFIHLRYNSDIGNELKLFFLSPHHVSVTHQFTSSFSGESALPPNLLLPSNLVDPARLSKSGARLEKV